MKIVSRIKDNKFNEFILPKVLSKSVYDKAIELLKDGRAKGMDEYLRKYYKMDLTHLVNEVFPKCLKVDKYKSIYVIGINENLKIGEYKVSELIHLLDYGNLSIKGLNLVRSAFSYVEGNIIFLHRLCLKGGLNYVN